MIQLNRILSLISGHSDRIAMTLGLLTSTSAMLAIGQEARNTQTPTPIECVQIERTLPPVGIEIVGSRSKTLVE